MKRHTPIAAEWQGPGAPSWRFSWRGVLWLLIYPHRSHRTGLTMSGMLLIVLSIAIGTAAYNSASNILFLTLALMLGCIILSGVLSWLNFRGLLWRLAVEPPLRAGQEHVVTLHVSNRKSFLPTYGVWFEVRLASTGETRELLLRERLDAGADVRLEATLHPATRGRDRVELTYVGSLFPFGFLRKAISIDLASEVVVWPAAIEYRRFGVTAWQRLPAGEFVRRPGQGGDLLSVRRYQLDDSHRQIHWKASARLRQLMVRQLAAETGEGFSLWLETSSERWTRPEQFEAACSFAATLAEDLFTLGTLRAAGVGSGGLIPVRRARDLELFLDRIALCSVQSVSLGSAIDQERVISPNFPGGAGRHAHRNLMTFAPEGARGVVAFVHGERAAAA